MRALYLARALVPSTARDAVMDLPASLGLSPLHARTLSYVPRRLVSRGENRDLSLENLAMGISVMTIGQPTIEVMLARRFVRRHLVIGDIHGMWHLPEAGRVAEVMTTPDFDQYVIGRELAEIAFYVERHEFSPSEDDDDIVTRLETMGFETQRALPYPTTWNPTDGLRAEDVPELPQISFNYPLLELGMSQRATPPYLAWVVRRWRVRGNAFVHDPGVPAAAAVCNVVLAFTNERPSGADMRSFR